MNVWPADDDGRALMTNETSNNPVFVIQIVKN